MKVSPAHLPGKRLRAAPAPPRLARIEGAELRSPQRKRRYNAALFAQVAPRYQLVTRCLSFGRDRSWKRLLVRDVLERLRRRAAAPAPGPDDRAVALDLACGTGDITLELARALPTGSVVGVDLSPDMLWRARRRAKRDAIANATFVCGDMNDLPAADESAHVVTGGYALRNAPDLESTLREVFRVLQPGGIAAFLEFSLPASAFRRTLQLRLLRFWGQVWGLALHGNPEIYAYIARSLAHFPDCRGFERMLKRTGFTGHRSRDLLGGFVRITMVSKPTR